MAKRGRTISTLLCLHFWPCWWSFEWEHCGQKKHKFAWLKNSQWSKRYPRNQTFFAWVFGFLSYWVLCISEKSWDFLLVKLGYSLRVWSSFLLMELCLALWLGSRESFDYFSHAIKEAAKLRCTYDSDLRGADLIFLTLFKIFACWTLLHTSRVIPAADPTFKLSLDYFRIGLGLNFFISVMAP